MKWIEVRITTTAEASDAVCEMLTQIGAGGVVIQDPDDIRREISRPNSLDYADEEFLESLGTDVIIKAYFDDGTGKEELKKLINEKLRFISEFLDVGKGFSGMCEVDDEDWANAWRKHYKPFRLSEHIVVKPSWEVFDAESKDIVIELDPGMAFGTGTHETTKMCAMLIDKHINKEDYVMDIGCGTGILSIVAAKLGASEIVAVDIDEVAVKVTKENCRVNGTDDVVNVFRGTIRDIKNIPGIKKVKADLIVANIIADVIIDMSKDLCDYLKSDGIFITSGIIKERKQEVVEEYQKSGFYLVESMETGEWVAMVFKCRDSL